MAISWEKYFMEVAKLTAKRSKDPKTQVGAVIVDPKNNHIVSIGYNGLPYGMIDTEDEEFGGAVFNWERSDDPDWEHSKHGYVVHAEANAILNSSVVDLSGMHLYVTMYPCNECAKLIAQKRIAKVIYADSKYREKDAGKIAARIFSAARIEVVQMN